ncbi:MAG: type II toxin-antitoxin system death-on-curing family toxin [Thermoanaerobaculia bacterium]
MRTHFLTLDEVLAVHHDQIVRYGGARGIRDIGLLQSAVAMPEATFGQEFLHGSLHEMAAAYLFHIARNHPFVDGNKRTALASALVFLWIHGHRIRAEEDDLVALVVGVAEGSVTKADVAVFLAKHDTASC